MKTQSQEETRYSNTLFEEEQEEEFEYSTPEEREYTRRERIRSEIRSRKNESRHPAYYILTFSLAACMALGVNLAMHTVSVEPADPVKYINGAGVSEKEDFSSFIVGDKTYHLPVQLKELEEDGWIITVMQDGKAVTGEVDPSEYYDIRIVNGALVLYGSTQWEYDEDEKDVMDLKMNYIYADHYATDLSMPIGISIGQDEDEAEEIIEQYAGEYEKNGSGSYHWYTVDGDEFYFSMNTSDGQVTSISMSAYEW